MSASHNLFNTLQSFDLGNGKHGNFYSLPALEEAGVGPDLQTARLHPHRARIGSAQLRRQKSYRSQRQANSPTGSRTSRARQEIPFVVARIVLQDFTGVPLLVDLAAMRSAVAKLGQESEDHRAARAGGSGGGPFGAGGFRRHGGFAWRAIWTSNFTRNRERYQFLKWGMQAFDTFKVVPPGIGIVHQVNLEYLAKGVLSQPTPTARRFIIPTRWSAPIRTRR